MASTCISTRSRTTESFSQSSSERVSGAYAASAPGELARNNAVLVERMVGISRGLGRETAVRTLRLSGIGESAVADILAETIHNVFADDSVSAIFGDMNALF